MHMCMYNIHMCVSTYKCDVHVHVIIYIHMYVHLFENLLVSPLNAISHGLKNLAQNTSMSGARKG